MAVSVVSATMCDSLVSHIWEMKQHEDGVADKERNEEGHYCDKLVVNMEEEISNQFLFRFRKKQTQKSINSKKV